MSCRRILKARAGPAGSDQGALSLSHSIPSSSDATCFNQLPLSVSQPSHPALVMLPHHRPNLCRSHGVNSRLSLVSPILVCALLWGG
jgi:hypothetical protein